MTDRCYYFGCWNEPGHFLRGPGGRHVPYAEEQRIVLYGDGRHLDGTLAPRRKRDGVVLFTGRGSRKEFERRIEQGAECPQGQFLRHVLDNGFTALQWWDRCQGDKRGACNSTILLEGEHDTETMLAALRENFPSVVRNIERHGVELVEVHTNA